MNETNPYESPSEPDDPDREIRAKRLARRLAIAAIPLGAIAGATTCQATGEAAMPYPQDIHFILVAAWYRIICGVPVGMFMAILTREIISRNAQRLSPDYAPYPKFELPFPAVFVALPIAVFAAYVGLGAGTMFGGAVKLGDAASTRFSGFLSAVCGFAVMLLVWQGFVWGRSQRSRIP